MIIKSIETCGYGNLPDGARELEGGLTAVMGANEKGKTFTWQAIMAGLYGDGATASTDKEVNRKWGSSGPYYVRLAIEHDGGTYIINRDYGEKKNLMIMPDGTEVKDKKKIALQVETMTGLPSQKSFEATASIPQDEVAKVGEEPSLRQIIEERIAGAGSPVDPLIKKINKLKDSIWSKSHTKGALFDQDRLTGQLQEQLDERAQRLGAFVDNKEKLAKACAECDTSQAELTAASTAYDGNRKYIKAKAEYEQADKALSAAIEKRDKCRQALEERSRANEAIGALNNTIDELANRISEAEKSAKARQVLGQMQSRSVELKGRIEQIESQEKELDQVQGLIDSLKEVNASDLKNAREMPGEISGLKTALSGQVFSIEITPESPGVGFSITADGQAVTGNRADMHGEAEIAFPGVASVRVKNMTGGSEPLVDEIKRKEDVLQGILDLYEAGSLAELEKLHSDRLESIGTRIVIEKEMKKLLADQDLPGLKNELRGLVAEIEKASKVAEAQAEQLSDDQLEQLKRERQKALEAKGKAEGVLNTSNGVLEVTGENIDELSQAVKDTTKKSLLAETALEESRPYECSAEEFALLEAKVNRLTSEVGRLSRDRDMLSFAVENETVSEEEVVSLEEQLEEALRTRDRMFRKHELLRIILDNISLARTDSLSNFSGAIEARMGEIISRVTGGRYSEIKVDGNLGVSVFSEEKSEYVNLDKNVPLSTGTVDQLYLAARLGILELIAGECRPPVLMDDTFSDFDDMGRKENAFEVLAEMAGEYQILYFTCHEVPAGIRRLNIA